jgi:hypothetical protein
MSTSEFLLQAMQSMPKKSAYSVVDGDEDNEFLKALQARKEGAEKEAVVAAIAGGVGSLLTGGGTGSTAKYGRELAMNRIGVRDKADADMAGYGMSMAKAKAKLKTDAGTKRYQQAKLELKNKKTGEVLVVPGRFDNIDGTYTDFSGKPIDTSIYQVTPAYKLDIKTDPTTGELGKFTQSGESGEVVRTQGQQGAKYNVRQVNALKDIKASLEKDRQFTDARKGYTSSQRAIELLQSDNPIADAGIKVIFPRMFGEVGNLAVQEQERFSGSPAIRRLWERLKSKWSEGRLSDEDRSDLMEVAKVMGEFDARLIRQTISEQGSAEAGLGVVNSDQILDYLGVFNPKPIKEGSVAKRARSKMKEVEGNVITAPNGRKFKRKANGKYVEIK